MADELERFLEEQKFRLEQDKAELERDPPYMEMRTRTSEIHPDTYRATDSIAKENILLKGNPMKGNLQTRGGSEENYGLSLPLGLEYDKKKEKLKEELRQDYRRYMAEKNMRATGELDPSTENLSLPISDRKSAKDRLRTERNKEYNQFLKELDEYEKVRRNARGVPKYGKENNEEPLDDFRVQDESYLVSRPPREPVPSRKDAYTSMEAYEELLNRKREEEGRYRGLDHPKFGQRRNIQTQTDRRSDDYQSYLPDIGNFVQKPKNEYRLYRERREQEPLFIEEDREDQSRRPVSAKPRPSINEIYDSKRERSKSATVRDDGIFGTGLLLGNGERESAHRRRREKYRQELLEQISEQQKNRKREKDLELNVAASGAVDPEKEPDRIRQFGAVTRHHDIRRRDVLYDPGEGPPAGLPSSGARSFGEEREPPEHPRVAFHNPAIDNGGPSGLHNGMWNSLGTIMTPRLAAMPPPPPPMLAQHYQTPYDNAYYYYGARNPLDPNLAYYAPGVMGVQPLSFVSPPNGLPVQPYQQMPAQPYQQTSSRDNPFMTSVPNSTVANRAVGFLPEQTSTRSKENVQSYQNYLKQQMQDREDRKRREKEETEKCDARLEQEMRIYNPWGRGGGGAPLRDTEGNLLTDLKKMHQQNEGAYRDYPQQDARALAKRDENLEASQNKNQGCALGNVSHFPQGNMLNDGQSEKQFREQEKYKDFLRLQIEEKRRKVEEEREKRKLEELQEEKRLAEQRACIAKELEEEQEKKRRKEEEQRVKNEEIIRLAEERRQEAERKRKEEEKKQDEVIRQQLEREETAWIEKERRPSPPIPTVKKKQENQRSPSVDSRESVLDRPQTIPHSPPVPARRNQLRAYEDKKDIISELSTLRRQLRSEERRLEGQLQNVDKEEDLFSVSKRREKYPDIFDLARQRIQAPVRRPSSKDSLNLQNIRDFNDLKYRDSATRAEVRQRYPDPPNDNNTLEIQQEALLREQRKNLDRMRRKETAESFVPAANLHNMGLTREPMREPSEDWLKNSLLESDSAFLGSHGETFPLQAYTEPTWPETRARDRRRRNKERLDFNSDSPIAMHPTHRADSTSLHSGSTMHLDQVRARNEQRIKNLDNLQQPDIVTLEDADDILKQFLSQNKERPTSIDTVATDPWLRPGTSETLRKFMDEHTQNVRPPSVNTSAFNWHGHSTAHG
ncbi:centrosome and spindle pole-associated protein 1 isoform X2 [Callorhinchus milii]|uniref:Centrosome and spindle pole-associated protein 1 C-terminal domain-containing protein n=1 Tax=Callorhinchus milii TaxID=7868 RepID=A0A4W3GT90_CALMI|nr:centrosome and spindle pole-associated protein 1 isoform X2 [Callorhinchus milii]|eukprot:gi/632940092/ref/XP_007885067.1/ PREDICTED: centrosome and spindle pole-associated protein 1 isoform X2 [Callorhinchus milii]